MARLEIGDTTPIRHQTTSRVISGAVTVTLTGGPFPQANNPVLIESVSEPSEDVMGGGAQKLEVINLERPYEWIAPAYDGGTVTITVAEQQVPGARNPYTAAGFAGFSEWVQIVNHATFAIDIFYENADGTVTQQTLHNCRVTSPVRPQGNIQRSTLRRSLSMLVGYTHRTTGGTGKL